MPTRDEHVRKLLLLRTGFFVVYQVKLRKREIRITSLIAKHSLAHRE